jgi:Domain of unknown function (DUF3846)
MTHVLIVQPDGTGSLTDLTELDDFRKAIGGDFIQMLKGGSCFALVDEDAKLLGAPNNPLASTLAMKLGYEAIPPDFLAGTVIFHSGVVDEHTVDISEHVIDVAVAVGIRIGTRPSWA